MTEKLSEQLKYRVGSDDLDKVKVLEVENDILKEQLGKLMKFMVEVENFDYIWANHSDIPQFYTMITKGHYVTCIDDKEKRKILESHLTETRIKNSHLLQETVNKEQDIKNLLGKIDQLQNCLAEAEKLIKEEPSTDEDYCNTIINWDWFYSWKERLEKTLRGEAEG